jgi:high affinity cGMP-specific 3',5'-cyclic phosphodiesterase 9
METEIAFKFNDQSVLENHHCLTSFTLLKNPSLNFLENLSKEGKNKKNKKIFIKK